jgi:hypothetical protein
MVVMMFWNGGGWPFWEIDVEEYRRLRDVLGSGDDRSPAGHGSGR